MARHPSKPTAAAVVPPAGPWRYAVPLAITWLALFAAYFLTRQLPNNPLVARLDLLLLLPDLLLANVFGEADGLPSGWRYLPQRFDLIATAAFIAAGAWGLGGLILRMIDAAGWHALTAGRAWQRATDHALAGRATPPGERGVSASWSLGIDTAERTAFTFGLGLSAWSLLSLLFGLAGWLSRSLFVGVLIAGLVGELLLLARERRMRLAKQPGCSEQPGCWLGTTCLAAMAPFLLAAALAAMLPPFDFDVKEYHLGGPKEWFQDGRVHFLPHNVYTSFPFLTEMLSLSAMVVGGDWYRGALAGQLLLAGFLPLTALTLFAIGRRLFGPTAGLIGALVYVTTPWSYRIAVIAYSEGGLTCYLALSLLAATLAIERLRSGDASIRLVLLTGLFAGSAMACKYPGVIQVVIPLGLALLAATRGKNAGGVSLPQSPPAAAGGVGAERMQRANEAAPAPLTPGFLSSGASPQGEGDRNRRVLRVGLIYTLGVLFTVGPWLAKNAIETGNPVYPLVWSVFGGRDWNAALNAKWQAGHRPPHHDPAAFFTDMLGIAAENDWQSLLVFAFAPLALLGTHRRAVTWIWIYVAYLYVAWWMLTHRIDRFWVPLLPAACVLAGAGATWTADLPRRLGDDDLGDSLRGLWRLACGAIVVLAVLFNLGVVTTPLAGNPSYLADLDAVARAVETPNLALLNRTLPPNSKVLLVGEAEIFDARFPVIYNTVFDRSLFEDWTAAPQPGVPKADWPLRPVDDIRRRFAEHGVTHVYVNWREILRYRTTYGFTPFITPERFEQLRRIGLLDEPSLLRTTPIAALGPAERREAEQDFASLLRGRDDERILIAAELYRVAAD